MTALFSAILFKLNKEKNITFVIDQTNYEYVKMYLSILVRNGFMNQPSKLRFSTIVPLTFFNPEDDEKFLKYIEEDLFGNINMKVKSAKKNGMVDNFLEVFSNVQIHAQTKEPVFACGQYFPLFKSTPFYLSGSWSGVFTPH